MTDVSIREPLREPRLSTRLVEPVAIKFQVGGSWVEGSYEIKGLIMIVRCGDASAKASIGLLGHRKLAKALLARLHSRTRRLPSPTLPAEHRAETFT